MLTATRTLLGLIAATLAGCSTASKTDVLEARLRSQEDMIAVYESQMQRVKTELASARRETEDLRLQMAEQGHPLPSAEVAAASFRATGIQFSPLMTGGLDTDGEPGHDALTVVLIPHDGNGELVKLPGLVEIEALDPTHPEGAQRIGHWQFDQRDIHQYWHKGVVQSGYQFQLPWQTAPRAEQVLVLAHLTTADGRRFDTNLTITVDPPGVTTDAPLSGGGQQVSAAGENPFAVRQASGEQSAETAGSRAAEEIIWAEGEGPAADLSDIPWDRQANRATPGMNLRSAETSDGSPRLRESAAPLQQRAPRPQPLPSSAPPAEAAQSRAVPPAIEDWWSDEDWSTREANEFSHGVQTSDSFTEQTRPRYR